MKLTPKLLGFLNRVFDKDPARFLAFRIGHASHALTWRVADGVMTIVPGAGAPLVLDLSAYTLGGMVDFIAGQGAFSLSSLDPSRRALSALVIMDGAGDITAQGGDQVAAYGSLLWSYIEALARQLGDAEVQIEALPNQMQVQTADGAWLDEIGSYYSVPRNAGELDSSYGPRIIAEAIRPRGNGIAIENAIAAYTGLVADLFDVTTFGDLFPLYDGVIDYDGSQNHDASPSLVYGLFDVIFAYDLVGGGDLAALAASVRSIIGRSRDAGTHLRSVEIYLHTQDGILTTEDGTPIVWPV